MQRIAHRRVSCDKTKGSFEQSFSGFATMPCGGAGRVRQRNKILNATTHTDLPACSDYTGKRAEVKKLSDSEPANREDEAWLKEIKLPAEPG